MGFGFCTGIQNQLALLTSLALFKLERTEVLFIPTHGGGGSNALLKHVLFVENDI